MRSIIISAASLLLLSACGGSPKTPATDSLAVSATAPSTDSLRQQISAIAAEAGGTVGVAIRNLNTGDTLTLNDTARLPMQSAFKFPIAMAVLKQVDEGKLSLEQTIPVTLTIFSKPTARCKTAFLKAQMTKQSPISFT